MMRAESWQTAEIPGPIKASMMKEPEKVLDLIQKSKNPVLFIGRKGMDLLTDESDPLQLIVKLSEKTGIRLITSSPSILKELKKRNSEEVHVMPPIELADRLRDPEWSGIDGGGKHDLAIFFGMPYYLEWLILSGIKHFAYKHLKTLTLDPYYHPNASFSLPNLPLKMWTKFMRELTS